MSANIPLDCIVNGATVAGILGVTRAYVSTLIQRPDTGFPTPLDAPGVAGVPLWDVREIVAWRDSPTRKTRRPSEPVNLEYVERYK